jgi:hypothetical protein
MTTLKRIVTICLFMAVQLTACSDAEQERNDKLLKVMEEGLITSNQKLGNERIKILHDVERKMADPASRDLMAKWESRVSMVDSLSNNLNWFISSLKDSLVANEKSKGNISRQQTDELYKRLLSFKRQILEIDSSVAYGFANSFTLTTKSFDSTTKTVDEFYQTFFVNNSVNANMAILTKFQNNIKNRQNEVMDFLRNHVGCGMGIVYDPYRPVVSTNSQHFKKGETMELSVGVGAYLSKSTVKLNGKVHEVSKGSIVIPIKLPSVVGKQSLPLEIEWKNIHTGKTEQAKVAVAYYIE